MLYFQPHLTVNTQHVTCITRTSLLRSIDAVTFMRMGMTKRPLTVIRRLCVLVVVLDLSSLRRRFATRAVHVAQHAHRVRDASTHERLARTCRRRRRHRRAVTALHWFLYTDTLLSVTHGHIYLSDMRTLSSHIRTLQYCCLCVPHMRALHLQLIYIELSNLC